MLQQFWKFFKDQIVTSPKNYNNITRYDRVQDNDFGLKAATSVLITKIVSPEVPVTTDDNEDIHLQDFSITKIKQKQYQSSINGNNSENVIHSENGNEKVYSKKCCRLDNGYYKNSSNHSVLEDITTISPSTSLSQKKLSSGDEYNYKYYCPYKYCTYLTIRPSTLRLHIVHTHDLNFPAVNGNYRGKKVTFSAPDGTRILFDEKSRNTVNPGYHIAVAMTTKNITL